MSDVDPERARLKWPTPSLYEYTGLDFLRDRTIGEVAEPPSFLLAVVRMVARLQAESAALTGGPGTQARTP